MLISGKTASNIIIVKMPPYHCERLRQNKIDLGNISGLGSIDAPVEVNPDIVSNKISANELMVLLSKKGNVPVKTTTIHVRIISKTFPLFDMKLSLSFVETKNIQHPTNKEITEGMMNGNKSSLLLNAIGMQDKNKNPSRMNKRDIIPFVFSNFIRCMIHSGYEVIFVIIALIFTLYYQTSINRIYNAKLSTIL